MANWARKITKACKPDLNPGEEVLHGLFVQPMGSSSSAMANHVGGIIGRLVVGASDATDNDLAGVAAVLPDDRVVLGLTNQRLAVWGHSTLSGKPKDFKAALLSDQLVGIEFEPLKTIYAVKLLFSDGSSKLYEAPRLTNDPEGFALAVAQQTAAR